MPEIILYHGSARCVQTPRYGYPNGHNDFGAGFYCTEDEELGREWAVDDGRDGYLNRYSLNMDGLKVLDLGAKEYSVLHWAELVCANRLLYEDGMDVAGAREYLASHFSLNPDGYDIITGSPADDCNLAFLMDFMTNRLPVQGLAKALRTDGRTQIVLKSPEAFARLRHEGSEPVSKTYGHSRKLRCSVTWRRYGEEVLGCRDEGDIIIAHLLNGMNSPEDSVLWEK